jgi:hypothetical protein
LNHIHLDPTANLPPPPKAWSLFRSESLSTGGKTATPVLFHMDEISLKALSEFLKSHFGDNDIIHSTTISGDEIITLRELFEFFDPEDNFNPITRDDLKRGEFILSSITSIKIFMGIFLIESNGF